MKIINFILLLCAILLLPLCGSYGQKVSDLNKQREQAVKDIKYIDDLIKKNSGKQKASIDQIALLEAKINSRKSFISNLDKRIVELEKEIQSKSSNISVLEKNLNELKESYSELLRHYYINRGKYNWVMFFLASENINQAYRRMRYMQSYMGLMEEQGTKIETEAAHLKEEVAALQMKKTELSVTLAEKVEERNQLQKDENELTSVINSLKQQEKTLKAQLAEKKKIADRLDKEIQKLILAETKKKTKQTVAEQKVNTQLSSKFAENKGKLPWPVKGIVTEKYGVREHPIYKSIKRPPNNGVDITTSDNATVTAVFGGIIKKHAYIAGMENCVIIQHGDYFTVYCHLNNVLVKEGDEVKVGTPIGKVFTPENSSAVMHFELLKGTNRENPENWLQRSK